MSYYAWAFNLFSLQYAFFVLHLLLAHLYFLFCSFFTDALIANNKKKKHEVKWNKNKCISFPVQLPFSILIYYRWNSIFIQYKHNDSSFIYIHMYTYILFRLSSYRSKNKKKTRRRTNKCFKFYESIVFYYELHQQRRRRKLVKWR